MKQQEELLLEDAPSHALYNVFMLGCNFMLLFFAFNTIQAFETTVHKDLGFISLATLYTFFSISTLFSSAVVAMLGPRITLFVGAFTYVLYLAANVKVVEPVLITASAVIGIGAALLWTAQGAFLIANTTPRTLSQRSGLFWAIFQLSGVFGNLTAAVYLHFSSNLRVMFMVFLAVGVIALFSFLLLRAAPQTPATVADNGITVDPAPASIKSRLLGTALEFTRTDTLMLAPIILYTGLSQPYFFGSIPPRLSALHGKQYIGYGLAIFALCDTLGALATGRVAVTVGRMPLSLVGFLLSSAGIALLSVANPLWQWFVLMGLLGCSDGVFQTLIAAFIGRIRPGPLAPAAFGFLKCLQATSTAAAYFYAPHVTFATLTLILLTVLWVGVIVLHVSHRFVRNLEDREHAMDDSRLPD